MAKGSEYRLNSTSRASAEVEDIELSVSPSGLTRKVLRAKVVENSQVKDNPLEIAIVHQRRGKPVDLWQDLGGKGLNDLKAGDAAKMQLDTNQTRALFDHLVNLYGIGKEGIRSGILMIADEDEVIGAEAGRARIIWKLLEAEHGQELWDALAQSTPGLATKLSLAHIYGERRKIVEEFERNLPEKMGEPYWQELLQRNRWIFGSAYIGQVGERRIDIKSTVDHPLIAEDGCLEVVEIKKPEFPFWLLKSGGEYVLYRGKYLLPHYELQGAIAQAQNYIFEIEREVDSLSWSEAHDGIRPIKPRCLVVHGRSCGWRKREVEALRLLNDSLHGISVITFDHLLVRAKQTLEVLSPGT